MTLVWKLLRRHVSVPQLVGFFFANLFGMLIVLLGFQFYRDVLPIFTQGDSFMHADYLVVSKQISTATTLSGRDNAFTAAEISDLQGQPFVRNHAAFTSTAYKVDARMGVNGVPILSSELFFESVPDDFIDISSSQWKWREGDDTVPIILPRSYINMYNFGFAQTHSMPKIGDGLVSLIDFRIFIHGNGRSDEYKGRVIGLSNRLNSILVPQSFMDWSNATYSADSPSQPTRLIVEVDNPANDEIARYVESHSLEVEDNDLNAEKTAYFLKMIVSIVVAVGVVISVLSFYILMLSIYLLVQKNASKLENLLLIGYSPQRVALPYQLLTVALNVAVLAIALAILCVVRSYYMEMVVALYPGIDESSLLPSICLGTALLVAVSAINAIAIRRKIAHIWHSRP